MIVLDTSGLLAAIDGAQRQHDAAKRAIDADSGPFLLSPFVLAELDYLLATRVGSDAEVLLLQQVATRAYQLEHFAPEDIEVAATVVERYRDLGVGLADASLVVLAARHRTTRILTLDERHFRSIRPLHGRRFKLLPADA